jgi:hypothetical protein
VSPAAASLSHRGRSAAARPGPAGRRPPAPHRHRAVADDPSPSRGPAARLRESARRRRRTRTRRPLSRDCQAASPTAARGRTRRSPCESPGRPDPVRVARTRSVSPAGARPVTSGCPRHHAGQLSVMVAPRAGTGQGSPSVLVGRSSESCSGFRPEPWGR